MTEVPAHLLKKGPERRAFLDEGGTGPTPENPELSIAELRLAQILTAFGVYEAARSDFLSVCVMPGDRTDLKYANGSAFGMLKELIEQPLTPRQQG
jgi:hypothetical protein